MQARINSHAQNFRYDVFQNQTLKGKYDGVSRIVRDKMNNPEYFNVRLKGIADTIRANIAKDD